MHIKLLRYQLNESLFNQQGSSFGLHVDTASREIQA